MIRYFKTVEITGDHFRKVVGIGLGGCSAIVSPEFDGVYSAIDTEDEERIEVEIDSFDFVKVVPQ